MERAGGKFDFRSDSARLSAFLHFGGTSYNQKQIKGAESLKTRNMEKEIINGFIEAVHSNAVKHGFWEGNPSDEHFLCLVVCELAEAVEAVRKCSFCHTKNMRFFEERIAEQPSCHEAATEAERYQYWFNNYVKDTMEDELADAYIRLCDLAGAHGLEYKPCNDMCSYVVSSENTFTENVLAITSIVTDGSIEIGKRIFACMRQVERLAELNYVNIEEHIKYKMRYNVLREYKHGKAF